jgi:cysteinyl-tRNA synthetase
VPTAELAQSLAKALADAGDATPDEIVQYSGDLEAALANDLNTVAAIRALEALAANSAPAARRVGKALGQRVLGLSFGR